MARSSGNKDHSGAAADPMDIDSDSGEEEEGAVDHERSDLQGEGDASAKTNVAEDEEVIEEAIQEEEERQNEKDGGAVTILRDAPDEETMELWNKMTVFDPIEGKEVHKATIAKLINEGIDVGSKSFDRTKRVQSVPRYSASGKEGSSCIKRAFFSFQELLQMKM